MRTLVKPWRELQNVGRWDIDFHLEAELIRAFDPALLKRVDAVADVAREKRDPGLEEGSFKYVDIASVDVPTGRVSNPQDVLCDEAPSRARKVLKAYDIVVSTCRPTRGAIAIVPPALHNEIGSTAFTVLRPKEVVNPIYLHFALRLASSREQFRKWSTGSSYPAILDEDVEKTLIPVPSLELQDQLAARIAAAVAARQTAIQSADHLFQQSLMSVSSTMENKTSPTSDPDLDAEVIEDLSFGAQGTSAQAIQAEIALLPPLRADAVGRRGRGGGSNAAELLDLLN